MLARFQAYLSRFRDQLLRPYVRVWVLRLAGLLALLIALWDPVTLRRIPDPQAFRMAVLADNSASMNTPDAPEGRTRRQQLQRWLEGSDGHPGLLASLRGRTDNLQVAFFADQPRPWDGRFPENSSSGPTAVGRALQWPLQEGSGMAPDLGAVLLLSDGINHEGPGPLDLARSYAAEGIPVSVIGYGSPRQPGDLSVRFARPRARMEENSPGSVTVTVSNQFRGERETQLRLFRGEEELHAQSIRIDAGTESVVEIPYTSGRPGVETLRAVLDAVPEDRNPATDTAYALRQVVGDGVTDLLYLAANPGWEFRQLRVLADESATLRLHSVVKVDEERFFRRDAGSDENATDASGRKVLSELPTDADFYLDKDLLILDAPLLQQSSPAFRQMLVRFVGTRGGGLLLLPTGGRDPLADLPAEVLSLFPVRETRPLPLPEAASLQVEAHPLFSDLSGGALLGNPPLTVAAGTRLQIPSRLSRAARQPVRLRGQNQPVLAIQAYGAGRTAYMAGTFAWNWSLASERGAQRHRDFYQGLLGWLATGGKQRLETPLNSRLTSLDESTALDIRLLGADYEPRMDARVSATLTAPDGSAREVALQPDLGQPGHYRASVELSQPGAYRAEYRAVFPNGEELLREAWFSASPTGPEQIDVRPREQILRDLARITGGRFFPGERIEAISEQIPVSAAVPRRVDRFSWTRTWPFLLLGAALLLAEWWLRRRLGLR